MKKILLIHPEGNINYNPNLTGIVEILCEQGYEVEIASARRSDFPQRDPCAGATFHVFDVPAIELARKHKFFIPAGLESNPGTLRTYINETFGEIHLVIGVDLGIIEASVVARALHVPFGLISYEIYFAGEMEHGFKKAELAACSAISFAVCQDHLRSFHLSRENQIPQHLIIHIPVAGRASKKRSDRTFILHDQLKIGRNVKIALYMGSVTYPWSMIDDLLSSTDAWRDDWVLLLHHRYGRDKLNDLLYKYPLKNSKRVFFSPFPELVFSELHRLLSEVDLGLAFYITQKGDVSAMNNLKYIGLASGKIATYLQYGVPVMINEIGEMSELVRKHNLGHVIAKSSDIPGALETLTSDRLFSYGRNALEFFGSNFDLDRTIQPLLKKLDAVLHAGPEPGGLNNHSMLLSLVLQGRNDSYMGNFEWRLSTNINKFARNVFDLHAEKIIEIVLVDWGSSVPLSTVLTLSDKAKSLLRIIRVSPQTAQKYNRDSEYSCVHPINTGIRNSKGKYILFCDGDTYTPLDTMKKLLLLLHGKAANTTSKDVFLMASRYHVPKSFQTSGPSIEEIDAFISMNRHSLVHDKINLTHFQGTATAYLMSREMWFECRGFDERLIYWGWFDIDLFHRLSTRYHAVDMEDMGMPFFHLEHYSDSKNRSIEKENPRKPNTMAFPSAFTSNNENWGLANERLQIISGETAEQPSPRFSVGMIVLNAELLLEACLESIYDFAHEILIVEGSCPQARWDARPDGTSRDRTLDIIRNFPDPAGKIRLVASRAWGHKDEMVNAFIPSVTGDYLFQVDSDEIWMEQDLRQLRRIVTDDPSVTCIEFRPKQFWHNFETILAEGHWEDPFMRVFKFEPGARWLSHEPPVLLDPGGHPYNAMKRINATTLFGTTFFHYSYLTEEQAKWKGEFFKRYYDLSTVPSSDTSTRVAMTRDWFEKVWLPWADDPDGIERKYGTSPGGGPAWRPVGKTSRYLGDHPPAIKRHKLWADPEYHVPASGAQTGKKKRTPGKKRALVSYITAPLRLPPDYHVQFSNPGIARSMVRVLNEMHYQVDVVEWTDQSFRSEESYDLFIGHGGVNWEYLSRNVVGNAVKIYFSTGIYWKEFNKAEAERFADLEKRRGIRLPYDRWISVSEEFANHDADAIVCLGNGNAARTYARFPLCIPMNNGVYADDRYSPAAKDFDAGRRRFLFFSGAGSVHKGLDRLIEAFSGLDAELYCAGQIERSFFEAYRQDLESHPNIHILGWVQLKSPQFYELMNSCNCVIFPSCAEGQPGSVLECMNQGLVPIISKESNIDVKDFGVLLKTSSIQEIMKTVKLVSGRSVTWHRTRSLKTRDEIVAHYSEAAFCRNLRAAVERVIRRVSSVQDVRGRIAADAEVDPGAYLQSHADVHRDRTIKNVLWVRTDAVGDAVLASSMLPHIREKYKNAKITVLCQEQVEELYKACPFVDDIITFQKTRAYEDKNYRDGVVNRIQTLHADVALISVYSRAPLTDLFAAGSNAKERIGFYGDLSNMDAETRDRNNRYYTRILPSEGDCEPEIRRHKDFLKGIGIEASRLGPVIWLTPEDEQSADDFFRKNNLVPEQTIALFAGVQNDVRLYEHYGTALSQICKDGQFTVVSLGAAADRSLNQQNLDAIGVRTLNLSGETTLRQAAAIIKRCRLAAGAETSMAHIACAVGTPNVIVMGGGHFGRFMPYSPLTSLVCLPLECCYCGWRCEFGRAHCIRDILPEVFAEAVRRTLDRASAKPRVFVQGESLWRPRPGLPSWKWFTKFPDIAAVEIIPVGDLPDISCSGSAPDERMLPAAELQMLLEQPGLPESAVMSLKQADEEFRQGDLSSARDRLRQILQAMPSNTRVIIAFGAVLFRLGDVENARREFLKAMILDRPYALDHLPVAALKDLAAFYKANGYADTALLLYKKVSEKAG